jgi:Domain of unknown function (DUF4190)
VSLAIQEANVTEQPPPQRAGMNGMAVASLVCSLFGWLCVVGPLFGLIFGFVALNQIKQTGQRGRGMALAGVILGGILVVLVIVVQLHRTAGRHVPNRNSGAPAVVMIVEPQAVQNGQALKPVLYFPLSPVQKSTFVPASKM